MIDKIKVFPLWLKISSILIIILVLLVVRVVLKAELPSHDSSANEDYFSYHGPKLVKLDQDLTNMTNDILKMSQGDTSPATVTDFNIQSGAVNEDIVNLMAYNGDVPSQYAQTDQELSRSLNDLLAGNNDITEAINNNDITSFLNDAQKIGEGRNLYKQAAQDMINAHNHQN